MAREEGAQPARSLTRRVSPTAAAAVAGGGVTAALFAGALTEPTLAHVVSAVASNPDGLAAMVGIATGAAVTTGAALVARGYTHGDVPPFSHPENITDRRKRFSSWGSEALACKHTGPDIRPALRRITLPGVALSGTAASVAGIAEIAHVDPHLAAATLAVSSGIAGFSAAAGGLARIRGRHAHAHPAPGE